jgi:hypothetical protein
VTSQAITMRPEQSGRPDDRVLKFQGHSLHVERLRHLGRYFSQRDQQDDTVRQQILRTGWSLFALIWHAFGSKTKTFALCTLAMIKLPFCLPSWEFLPLPHHVQCSLVFHSPPEADHVNTCGHNRCVCSTQPIVQEIYSLAQIYA